MKGFSKLHVKSAIKSRNKFDLSCSHMTTLNFGDLLPIHIQDCIIGDDMNMKADSFMRLAPMVVPTYGNIAFKTASVFVPYRTVFEDAEAFFAGDKFANGEEITLPKTTFGDLIRIFINTDTAGFDNTLLQSVSTGHYDLSYRLTTTGALYKYKFTAKGKRYYKILRSLGYAIPNMIKNSDVFNQQINILPLLCYAKAYNDWFARTSDLNTSSLTQQLHTIKTQKTKITDSQLKFILDNIHLLYEDDYFTTAWRYPNSAIYGNSLYTANQNLSAPDHGLNEILLRDPSQSNPDVLDAIDNRAEQTYITTQSDLGTQGTHKIVNQRSLDFLAAFDKWLRRNNYSGSRAVERVLSRFGIKSSDYRSEYSEMVNMSQSPIQIGDIMANAQTDADVNGELGSYAGKGIMSDSASFKYKVSDFGMMITFGWIALKPYYPQGADRTIFKTSYSDFYVPEYDGLGASPILQGELAIVPNDGTTTSVPMDVFGFTERYNEYRYGRDRVTGDFELYPEMSSWTLGRDMINYARGNFKAQSNQLLFVDYDGEQFNRIFADTNSDVDHFYLTSHFDVSMVRPILNLNQVPQLGEGDTDISRNGTKIS